MAHPKDVFLGSAHPGASSFPLALSPPEAQTASAVGPPGAQRSVYTDVSLRGGKRPYRHRFYLVDSRVVEGEIYRDPSSRLVDDLYGTKGDFICVVNARHRASGEDVSFMVINLQHIVCIEEL